MLALLVALSGSPALAQDVVDVQVVRKGQVGGPPPTLVVKPLVDLARLDVRLACGEARARHDAPASAGGVVPLALDAPTGRWPCAGTLAVHLSDGTSSDMPLSFEIEVLPRLALELVPGSLDLERGAVTVRAERPLAGGAVELWGERGALGGGAGAEAGPEGLRLTWTPPGEEVLRLELVARDAHGFGAALELFPWSYSVPHEEVVFETGQAAVRPSEEPKLQAAWAEVERVVARYGAVAPVNLYVAGYTDTVGAPAVNQRLSEERARAIAGWFRTRGFAGAIHYQGFGEAGLLVATPDEVDEERNRRVDYIVAAEAPPPGPTLPAGAWRPL